MIDTVGLVDQLGLGFRLVVAAVLGALIGLEREIHAHPAGMRTHLLVSMGAAMFTVVSIYGFVGPGGPDTGPVDPTRVAAQIVSGIGFLGAGAIIKYGTSIRGLTTAGSLWATAAVGMAAGTGQLVLAVAGWAVVLFSLWPLNWIIERLQIKSDETIRLRLHLHGMEPLGLITTEFTKMRADITEVRTERTAKNRYDVELEIRPQPGTTPEDLIRQLSEIPDVDVVDAAAGPAP